MEYNVKIPLKRKQLLYVCTFGLVLFVSASLLTRDAELRYEKLLSPVVYDRNEIPIRVYENAKGHYALRVQEIPEAFTTLLLTKEDRFFYYHIGVNPISMLRAALSYVREGKSGGSSTLTLQLAKNILHTENDRTIRNKIRELFYAMSMELCLTKDTILSMYVNTVYLGNQIQGFETASRAYFKKTLRETTVHERMMLLATLSYPGARNPKRDENEPYARALMEILVPETTYVAPPIADTLSLQNPAQFEYASLNLPCETICTTTLDTALMEDFRSILVRTIAREYDRGVRNGAIVVINPHTEELIALVGSPDPTSDRDGSKINMALEPRPIGSTVKPFIYLKGFVDGLSPYTIVDDREYKYPISTGYSLYPKNFDGSYHGEISLHYALSNSLNVPSVKVLEYIGLNSFYNFLTETLRFKPLQPLDSYQYGIALGGLEMDLLTLTHYTTLFPRGGTLAPLQIVRGTSTTNLPPQSHITEHLTVAPKAYTTLLTTLLSDRHTGVEQFGQKSSLNLTISNYAVKTGTSRDFHDSWVIGYTPDLAVGVWLGNAENTALAQVSGQSGAGAVWHDIMEYLVNTPYYTNTPFTTDGIHAFTFSDTLEWGFPEDVVSEHETLLTSSRLIVSLHENDVFELEPHTTIPLRSRIPVSWFVNGVSYGESTDTHFNPSHVGTYEIEARSEDSKREIVHITITSPR